MKSVRVILDGDKPEAVFIGRWSKMDILKAYRLMLRGLPVHLKKLRDLNKLK